MKDIPNRNPRIPGKVVPKNSKQKLEPLAEHFVECYEQGKLVSIIAVEDFINQELASLLRQLEGKVANSWEEGEIITLEDLQAVFKEWGIELK